MQGIQEDVAPVCKILPGAYIRSIQKSIATDYCGRSRAFATCLGEVIVDIVYSRRMRVSSESCEIVEELH